MDKKMSAKFWQTAAEMQAEKEHHISRTRNDELRQKLQQRAQELKRIQEATHAAERAALSRERAEALVFHVQELQQEIERSDENRRQHASVRGNDPMKLDDARRET